MRRLLPLVVAAALALVIAPAAPVMAVDPAVDPSTIVGWGDNGQGQAAPPAGSDYVAVAAGQFHSLALRSDGSVVAWGANSYGQATVPAGNVYVAIGAGNNHSIALRSDGTIVGWGDNTDGRATPPAGNDYTAIAAGYHHNLALRSDGSIVGWGDNTDGRAAPPAGNDYIAIAAGGRHSLALRSDGSIVGWGDNTYGGIFYGQATPPSGDFVAIAAGTYHSLGLRSDGSVVAWGFNQFGNATPPAGNDFVAIAAGAIHSLALRGDGSIVGWGYDGDGRASSPGDGHYVAIEAGLYHSLALLPLAVEVSTDRATFITETGATSIEWPADANLALPLRPWPYNDYSCTTGSVSLASGQITVTRDAGTHLCFLGAGWNAGLANINPQPTGPTLVVSGEDDYTVAIAFAQPVHAVGFGLLTNKSAIETVTLSFLDGRTAVIGDAVLETAANQFEFIGFTSDNPITGVKLNTTGGASQNEGITGIWTAGPGACYSLSSTSTDFLPPFDDSSPSNLILNKMKNGRVVPVKVTLFNACTQAPVDPTANVAIKVTLAGVPSGTDADPVEVYADAGQSSAGTDFFRWSPDGFWIYNLDSKALRLTTGKTYRIDVYVDGVKFTVNDWALLAPVK